MCVHASIRCAVTNQTMSQQRRLQQQITADQHQIAADHGSRLLSLWAGQPAHINHRYVAVSIRQLLKQACANMCSNSEHAMHTAAAADRGNHPTHCRHCRHRRRHSCCFHCVALHVCIMHQLTSRHIPCLKTLLSRINHLLLPKLCYRLKPVPCAWLRCLACGACCCRRCCAACRRLLLRRRQTLARCCLPGH